MDVEIFALLVAGVRETEHREECCSDRRSGAVNGAENLFTYQKHKRTFADAEMSLKLFRDTQTDQKIR